MGFFRRRHRFKVTPLSLSVPLDGCDSVVGLQELQRRKDGELLAKALNLSGSYGTSKKPAVRRYKGQGIWDVTLADAQQSPKPWLDFIWGADFNSYSLSEGLRHLGERSEENLVYYLPNYLRVLLCFIIIAMFFRPWSILGTALLAITILASPIYEIHSTEQRRAPKQRRHLTARQIIWLAIQQRGNQCHEALHRAQEQQEAQQRQSAGPEGPGLSQPLQQSQAVQGGQDMSQSWVFMICTFLFFFSGIPLVLVRALVFSALVVLLHCTLRQTPCEFKEALGAAGQKGGMRPAGVPFLEVLGLRTSSNPDPRRLFRESWSTLTAVASAAGLYTWHSAQSKCMNSLRYLWT